MGGREKPNSWHWTIQREGYRGPKVELWVKKELGRKQGWGQGQRDRIATVTVHRRGCA